MTDHLDAAPFARMQLDASAIAQWLKEYSGGDEWRVEVSNCGSVATIEPVAPMPAWKYRAVTSGLAYRFPPECTLVYAAEQRAKP